jgi:DnaJ-class molecular chaperone
MICRALAKPARGVERWALEGDGRMTDQPMAPGDQAAPGTPGTGKNVCPRCNGSGTIDGGTCPTCDGSGTVIEGIGGG